MMNAFIYRPPKHDSLPLQQQIQKLEKDLERQTEILNELNKMVRTSRISV